MYKYRKVITIDGKQHDIRANTIDDFNRKLKKIRTKKTVSEWADEAFHKYKHLTDYNMYVQWNQIENHILPYIGKNRIDKVRPIDCQEVLNKAEGLSQYSIRRIYQLLGFIFRKAVENGIIERNPTLYLQQPKGGKTKRRSLTEEEQQRLRETLKNDRYLFFRVMLECGLRNSEVSRLKNEDILYNGNYYLKVNGTKSESSSRIVPISSDLAQKLHQIGKNTQLLFTNRKGGILSKSAIEKLWNEVRQKADIDAVSYDLRHTYCTNLMRANIDIRIAQKLMGHSDIRLTSEIYTHVDIDDLADISDRLAKYMAKQKSDTV